MTTYYLLPQTNGGFILFNESGFETKVPTIKFAKSYTAFQGAELVILKADGTPRVTVH